MLLGNTFNFYLEDLHAVISRYRFLDKFWGNLLAIANIPGFLR